jgi:hypothetical protein
MSYDFKEAIWEMSFFVNCATSVPLFDWSTRVKADPQGRGAAADQTGPTAESFSVTKYRQAIPQQRYRQGASGGINPLDALI